jgi:hypothetical protein
VPTEVIVTRWASEPTTLGSYSFMATSSSSQDYDTMAQPVASKIFFAGEATNQQYPGTVHGALLSGERAAEEASAQLAALGLKPTGPAPATDGVAGGSGRSGDAAPVGGSAGRGGTGNGTAAGAGNNTVGTVARSGAASVGLPGALAALLAGAASCMLL